MNIAKIKLLFPYITLKRGGFFLHQYSFSFSIFIYRHKVSRDYVLCITKQTHRTEHPMCTDNVNLIFDSFFLQVLRGSSLLCHIVRKYLRTVRGTEKVFRKGRCNKCTFRPGHFCIRRIYERTPHQKNIALTLFISFCITVYNNLILSPRY